MNQVLLPLTLEQANALLRALSLAVIHCEDSEEAKMRALQRKVAGAIEASL